MVLLAYNQFCSAERLSRQSLASFTRNDSGHAHWIPNEGRGYAHRADADNPRSLLYVYMLYGVHAYGRMTSVRDPSGAHCV